MSPGEAECRPCQGLFVFMYCTEFHSESVSLQICVQLPDRIQHNNTFRIILADSTAEIIIKCSHMDVSLSSSVITDALCMFTCDYPEELLIHYLIAGFSRL